VQQVASQEAHPRSLRLFLSCSDGNSPRRGSKLPGNVNGTDAKGTKKKKEKKTKPMPRGEGKEIGYRRKSITHGCGCATALLTWFSPSFEHNR